MIKIGQQAIGTFSNATTSYVSVTIDPATDYATLVNASDGSLMSNNKPVTIVATLMPNPATINTTYYIVNFEKIIIGGLGTYRFQLSLTIGGAAIDFTTSGTGVQIYLVPSAITSQLPWSIYWKHRTGGLKRFWYYGQDGCPIVRFKFENNLSGCGAGVIELAYIDFPIDPEDLVYIYRNNSVVYVGMVDTIPDIKGGELDLIPIWSKYENALYNGTVTTQTIAQIIATVAAALQTNTGVLYNAALISTGSVATYTITYNYETGKKIMDDLRDRTSNRFWGVNQNGYLYLQQYDSVVSKNLFYSDPPAYTDIKITKDYSGIKATRFQVYTKNSGSSGTSRAGQVGYGAPYPPLAIETITRVKEDKITAPDILNGTDALVWAYAVLQSYQPKVNITVNHIDLTKYEPYIGQLVTVQDREDYELSTKIDCESTTNWTNATLDNTVYTEGTGSVKFTSALINAYMEYIYPNPQIYYQPQKIGMMIYATNPGSYMTIYIYTGYQLTNGGAGVGTAGLGAAGVGETVTDQTFTIITMIVKIDSANVWFYQDYNFTGTISKIRFEFTSAPPSSTTVYIDRIQVYQMYRATYTQNVVQIDYEISPDDENVTAHLLSYDTKSNSYLFDVEQKVKNLTTISSS